MNQIITRLLLSSRMASRVEKNDFELETVLVLQGGGSLGAYECGVYKALARYVKKFDIVAWYLNRSN